MSNVGSYDKRCLVVVGYAPSGLGYPQAHMTVDVLRKSGSFDVLDFCRWEPEQLDFWAFKTGSRARTIFRGVVVLLRSFLSVLKVRFSGAIKSPGKTWIYFPYPAMFSLIAWSIVCRQCQSRIVCDAYISVFDSAVSDRGILHSGLLAKILFKLEQNALSKAHRVIVDTTRNEERLSELFQLPKQHFASMPIAIPEERLKSSARNILRKSRPSSDLIFFGAISPLHGIDVVLDAFELLSGQGVSLTIVGDGQHGRRVAEYLGTHPRAHIHWIREWQPLENLTRIIIDSKIALGVFGGAGKASTVLPLKAYIALCLGMPFVTQRYFSLPAGAPPPPFVTCQNHPSSLAEAVSPLLKDSARRRDLATASRLYFDRHLSNKVVLANWRRLAQATELR